MMFDLREEFVQDFDMDFLDGSGSELQLPACSNGTRKLDDPEVFFSNFLLEDDDQSLKVTCTSGYISSSSSGMEDNSSADWENSSHDSYAFESILSSSTTTPTPQSHISTPKVRDLRTRVLDKRQRHLDLEKVRRQDMNQKYDELRQLCNAEKADKGSILESAILAIEQHNARVDSVLSALVPFSF
jgi:hypothetical protein